MDIQVRGREPTGTQKEAPKPSGGGISPDKLKIIVAVALLVLAGVAVAWNFGVFEGGPKYQEGGVTPLGVTQEEEEKIWKEAERERDRVHPPATTPPPSGS
jgi:hypothetical protein